MSDADTIIVRPEVDIVHAQLEVFDTTAELWLNGIPVSRIENNPSRVPIENVAVAQLLIPGTNMLELLVEPGSHPSIGRSEKRELPFKKMSAFARLLRFRAGASGMKEEGELLGEVFFRWEDASLDKQVFPQSSAVQIEMGAAYGRWGWQDAPELVVDDALIAEARAVLDEVESAIRSFHADRFWALTELQIKDVLRAYPAVTEAYLRSDLEAMFNHYRDKPDPVMKRNPDDHDFRLVAGGRLLQCVDKDYSTSFKLRDPEDGTGVPYRIMLARVDGKLRIVR
jgi:hypothetical protein